MRRGIEVRQPSRGAALGLCLLLQPLSIPHAASQEIAPVEPGREPLQLEAKEIAEAEMQATPRTGVYPSQLRALRADWLAGHLSDDELLSTWRSIEGAVVDEIAPYGLDALEAEDALVHVVGLAEDYLLSGRMLWRAAERLTLHRVLERGTTPLPTELALRFKDGTMPTVASVKVLLRQGDGRARAAYPIEGGSAGIRTAAARALESWSFAPDFSDQINAMTVVYVVLFSEEESALVVPCGAPKSAAHICRDLGTPESTYVTCEPRTTESVCHRLGAIDPLPFDMLPEQRRRGPGSFDG